MYLLSLTTPDGRVDKLAYVSLDRALSQLVFTRSLYARHVRATLTYQG